MRVLKFKRFTRPNLLRGAGRPLLQSFLSRFSTELAAAGITLPDPALADDPYCPALAGCLLAPDALPESLNEALYAIDEMANTDGRERLEYAVAQAGLALVFPPESTHLEVALQVWLAAPELLSREHNRQRMLRLKRFEYWGGPAASVPALSFALPGRAAIDQLVAGLDAWFARHQRGHETARVEEYTFGSEFWFLIRHGDTFARTPKVERQQTEMLHFRPERDDVVVYSPELDEIRINARTRGERELYREAFGMYLRGSSEHFSDRSAYSLEPLRADGAEALDVRGIEGLRRVRLRELEVVAENGRGQFSLRGAEDLLAPDADAREVIPASGRLARALFELEFEDSTKPRPVEVRPPNILKLARHCDAPLTHRWLGHARIRLPRGSTPPPGSRVCGR